MRIRSDYVPRAQARRLQTNVPTALCPNCKQQIPVSELEQHMRIELLDPRWKEQRAKAESRSATTNLSTTDVVNNLKRLASQRSDVFDATPGTQATPGVDPDEESRRKRVATAGPPGYDGPVPPGAFPPNFAPPPGTVPPGSLPPNFVPPPGTVPPGTAHPMPTVGPTGAVPSNPPTLNIEEQIRQIHERYRQ